MAHRTALLLSLAFASLLTQAQKCAPAITLDKKPQVFVMSDISNEPDDAMSFVRLLVHSDLYNITGMVAVTSYWQNSSVYPDQILNLTTAYGKVVDNLNVHSAGELPTAEYLASTVHAGQPVYGTAALGTSNLSSGATRLIAVVDAMPDDEILHIQAWGGMNMLGEALFHIQHSRVPHEIDRFLRKLRIYAISDQDNVGQWLRTTFPSIPYIVSLHGWNEYGMAAWTGMSGEKYYNFDHGGPDTSLVSDAYIKRNFQLGPLGSLYPNIAVIMEGDSPSLLHTIQNGLNGGPFDHPEWGGWGGRYKLLDVTRQTMVYSDARDEVAGLINKQTFTSSQASIWRWRQAYQDEMSARIQWTLEGNYSRGSHAPVVSINGSCGSEPLVIDDIHPSESITLDASGTYDPDAHLTARGPLQLKWMQYREPSATQSKVDAEVPWLGFTLEDDNRMARFVMPNETMACQYPTQYQDARFRREECQEYHVILEVLGSGTPPIHRYKRVVLKVQPPPGGRSLNGRRKRDEL
ncbi:DUF1593-domain-containing protein [Teratosphaeria nubilosa]|uniref:DUF1593-domain-containing protein n=1 Tax=Teratosphaeria nubilosa TaxID=161662 RepID=A0A6G1LHV3_9PEZI|nr:DUF1593-domain-containing protein [Teratosphaeria nubilosa]